MAGTDLLTTLLQLDGPHTALTLVHGRQRRIQWSFAELQAQRVYCQLVLQCCDVEPGDSVVVITHNGPQFFALLLATMALDVCLLPLHPDCARSQVLGIVEQQKPRVIIIDENLPLPTWLARQSSSLLRLRAQEQHWLREVLDTPLQAGPSHVVNTSLAPSERRLLLLHSSGAAAQSSAMYYTRGMLNTILRWQRHLFAAFADHTNNSGTALSDRVNVMPVTHWSGLCLCLQALLEGRTVHLLRSGNMLDHLHLLRETDCQLLMLVPTVIAELLQPDATPPRLPALRHCLTVGESTGTAQLEQLSQRLGIRVHVMYDMNECLSGFAHEHERLSSTPVGSCGRLVFGEAKLVTSDGAEHPHSGELWVRNETTVPCYLDRQLVHRKYRDGWYRTGDLFIRDEEGYYFFQGRVDAMRGIDGRGMQPAGEPLSLAAGPAAAVPGPAIMAP